MSSVAGTVEHPDIRYVVYPVHLDGSRTGAKPRLRHDPDCSHFEWRDGTILGTPELATEEQMHTLRACKTCIAARAESLSGRTLRHEGWKDRRGLSHLQPGDALDRRLRQLQLEAVRLHGCDRDDAADVPERGR